MSLFTSFAFSMAAYLLAVERQLRVDSREHDVVGAEGLEPPTSAL